MGDPTRKPTAAIDWRALVEQNPELTLLCDEHLKVKVASDAAVSISGYPLHVVVGSSLSELIHREDLPRVVEASSALTNEQPHTSFDLRVIFADHAWHDVNVRCRLLRADPGGVSERLYLLTARDVTVDRRNAAALSRKIELESLLERVQHRFINATSSNDEVIVWALAEIAGFLGADRSYIVQFDWAARTESMSHEWSAPDIIPDEPSYQDVSFDLLPATWERTMDAEALAIADVSQLDGNWAADRDYYQAEGIRSVLAFSIIIDGTPVGDLGLEWIHGLATWTPDDLTSLGMFASTFAQLMARRDSDLQLAQSNEQLQRAFDGSPMALALIGADGVMLQVNDQLSRLVERPADELTGSHAIELVTPEFRQRCIEWGTAVISADSLGTSVEIDPDGLMPNVLVQLQTGSGRAIWADIAPRPVRSEDGAIVNFVIQLADVTEARRTEVALHESEVRFATLVDNLPDALIRIDEEGRTIFANLAARRLRGNNGEGTWQVSDEVLKELTNCRIAAFETMTVQRYEYEIQTPLGLRIFESRFVPEPSPDGRPRSVLLVSSDLTDSRHNDREIAHRASHDDLTDLPNRSLFLSHLDVALDQVERSGVGQIAVIFFDLDNFKVVNDSLGHASGDELLKAVARRLSTAVRPGDVVARLGGDEFTVLLSSTDSIDLAMQVAERMRVSLATPILVAGRELIVTASVGLAVATTGKESPDELMAWADAAMYRSKAQGRDRVTLFDDVLAQDVRRRLDLDQRLRLAMDNDEFEVYFQPEVDLSTGAILGAEALLRWRTDEGVVTAADFIEIAEETGIIVPIGWWVLGEACRAAAAWPATSERPDGVVVRVNLAAKQIDQPDLVERVGAVLDASGLPPERLCLEITETALMANAAASRQLLEALDELGVELAVDDFGTGYSSLSYLKQFPVDVLKIDRSFVDGLPGDPEDTAIVTTIIRLAESLGMTVTAEGIEHPEQAERLVELGCGRGQGFHFARPMPLGDFRSLLAGPGTC